MAVELTPGDCIHPITIQANSTPRLRSASGQFIDDWGVEVCMRWCAMYPKGSREVFRASQVVPETTWVLRCEGYVAIEESMRAMHDDGRVFDILGVHGDDGKRPADAPWLMLLCREGASKGS